MWFVIRAAASTAAMSTAPVREEVQEVAGDDLGLLLVWEMAGVGHGDAADVMGHLAPHVLHVEHAAHAAEVGAPQRQRRAVDQRVLVRGVLSEVLWPGAVVAERAAHHTGLG